MILGREVVQKDGSEVTRVDEQGKCVGGTIRENLFLVFGSSSRWDI